MTDERDECDERLEVGKSYRAIGPNPGAAVVEVVEVDSMAELYRLKGHTAKKPAVILFGCERFWLPLDAAPESDARSDTDAPSQESLLTPWWEQRMACFDLETTGPLPEEARIVSAAIAIVGGGLETIEHTWLADPGVPIPEGAAAVHGITTERAQAEGRPAVEVVREVVEALRQEVDRGVALVIFNARYDLTVLDRECRRHGIEPLDASRLRVVDPSVLDKFLDRYRKSFPNGEVEGAISTRKLEGMCGVYGARLDGAHDATFDAIAAGRLAWAMGKRGRVVRRKRHEADALQPRWLAVKDDLEALHAFQYGLALEERARFAEYKRSIGELEEAERIEMEQGWPVLAVMPHEEWAPAPQGVQEGLL